MSTLHRFTVVMTCIISLSARSGLAQTTADRAAAQAQFDAAMVLMETGEYAKACPKLAASHQLDAQLGTQFNLGACYEKLGRFASAWINFREVADKTEVRGQQARSKLARERATALEPRLNKLRIAISGEAPEGLVVLRGGEAMSDAGLDTDVAVDAGKHLIEVHAPGHVSWSTEIEVAGEGKALTVRVPALVKLPPPPVPAPLPAPPAPTVVAPDVVSWPHAQHIAALAVGGVGLGLLGVGTGFGVDAANQRDRAVAHCNDQTERCDDDGLAFMAKAGESADVATGMFIAGGVLTAGGVVLWLTAPATGEKDQEGAWLSLHPGARQLTLRASGRW